MLILFSKYKNINFIIKLIKYISLDNNNFIYLDPVF